MRVVRPVFWGCFSAALVGCGGAGTTPSGQNGPSQYPQQPPAGNPVASASVDVLNNAFSPASVSLTAGGTVTWTWVGSGHSVTSDGQPSFSPTAPVSNAPRTLGPVVFSTAGQYNTTARSTAGPGATAEAWWAPSSSSSLQKDAGRPDLWERPARFG